MVVCMCIGCCGDLDFWIKGMDVIIGVIMLYGFVKVGCKEFGCLII